MAKTYFWLKIQDEFFRQKEIKILRNMERGAVYIIIYQKMLLYSLKNESKLFFDNLQDTFEEELALLLDEKVEDVKATVDFLEKANLMECVSSDEFLLLQVNELTGRESETAKRVRKHRESKKEEDLDKKEEGSTKEDECDEKVEDSDEKVEGATKKEEKSTEKGKQPVKEDKVIAKKVNVIINNDEDTLKSDETFCNKNVTPYIDTELEKELEKEKELHIDLNKGMHKNKKQKKNKKSQNKLVNECVDESVNENLSKIIKLYEENIGPIYPANTQYFIELSEKIEWTLFKRAIEICIDKSSVNPAYLKGIIKKWHDQNIYTLEALKAKEMEMSNKNKYPVGNDIEKHKLKNKSSQKEKIDEKMLAEMNDLEKKLGVS